MFKKKPRKYLVSVGHNGQTRTIWANSEHEARMKAEIESGQDSGGVTDITDQKSDFEILNQKRWR